MNDLCEVAPSSDPIVIQISRRSDSLRRYRIAGQDVDVDVTIDGLEEFFINGGKPIPPLLPEPCNLEKESRTIYEGPGWLGRRWRTTRCVMCASGTLVLDVEGAAPLAIFANGRIVLVGDMGTALGDSRLLAEITIGPALILALALRGVYCLHASSILMDGQAIAFAGVSGAGKSTMVRDWPAPGQRLTDDIMPITWSQDRFVILPRYPQLKWAPGEQASLNEERDGFPLASINILNLNGHMKKRVDLERLTPAMAFHSLLRHSVASQLFPPDLTMRACDFWASVSKTFPVSQLTYFRRIQALPWVRSEITRRL